MLHTGVKSIKSISRKLFRDSNVENSKFKVLSFMTGFK